MFFLLPMTSVTAARDEATSHKTLVVFDCSLLLFDFGFTPAKYNWLFGSTSPARFVALVKEAQVLYCGSAVQPYVYDGSRP